MPRQWMWVLLIALLAALATTEMSMAQPGGGPGGGGGGPGDPPRDTPGLDPVSLGGLATAGYFGYQYWKTKKGA